MHAAERVRDVVHRWVAAIEARDVDAVLATLAPGCTYRNVPEAAAVGHDAIRAMFATILARSDRVRFDVIAEAYEPGRGWLERADRFWIDGVEHTVVCNGVFEVDGDAGRITAVRDYCDLTRWRQELAQVRW